MRIISGFHKGRRIPVRKNFPSRPTTDFAKENIFNILHNNFDFEEVDALDLFAGTGSISYEFASRGASVTSIEVNYKSVKFIEETAHNLKMENLKVIRADVFKFIEKTQEKWDIIFADPPFQMNEIEQLPDLVLQNKILKSDGLFILEHSDQKQFTDHPQLKDKRSYGSVNFSIFG